MTKLTKEEKKILDGVSLLDASKLLDKHWEDKDWIEEAIKYMRKDKEPWTIKN